MNPYKYNHDQFLFDSTIKERRDREISGMIALTPQDVHQALFILGFKIQNAHSFYYNNTANPTSYKAKSCYIIDIKTKLSFANIDFGIGKEESDRRDELQKIRRDYFGVEYKKQGIVIWDI